MLAGILITYLALQDRSFTIFFLQIIETKLQLYLGKCQDRFYKRTGTV